VEIMRMLAAMILFRREGEESVFQADAALIKLQASILKA
jgi:hypothetical protein